MPHPCGRGWVLRVISDRTLADDVDTPLELRRFNPGLGVRDLLLYDPRVFSMADIDIVGLQPVASLLI